MAKKEDFGEIISLRSIIFFFDVFLSFMIISASYLLIRTSLGKLSLLFGGSMLIFSLALRALKHW